MASMPYLHQLSVSMNKLSGVLNEHLIVVVDADKDLEEMKEVFTRQENKLMGRGRIKQNTEDKENIAESVGWEIS